MAFLLEKKKVLKFFYIISFRHCIPAFIAEHMFYKYYITRVIVLIINDTDNAAGIRIFLFFSPNNKCNIKKIQKTARALYFDGYVIISFLLVPHRRSNM